MDKNIIYGPKSPVEISKNTLGEQLYEKLKEYEHLPNAIIDAHTNEKLSYKAIFDKTRCLAINLQKLGVNENSVVGIFSENSMEFLLAVTSCLYLGTPVTTFNPDYTAGEIIHAARTSKPSLIFCSNKTLNVALKSKQELPSVQHVVVLDAKVDNLQSLGDLTTSCSKNEIESFRPASFDTKERVAFIIYSSGTTGLPKGVLMTHNNYSATLASVIFNPRYLPVTIPGEDASLAFLPFYHAYGLLVLIMNILIGRLIVMLKTFIPQLFLQSIQDYKIKELNVVPTLATFLIKSDLVNKYDLSSIVDIICASAPLSKETEDLLKQKLNLKVVRQGYGMTEIAMVATMSPFGPNTFGSCGEVVPYLMGKIIDLDTGKSLGPLETGELCFKGDAVMKGYANNIEATNNTIDRDGWIHTGDVGYYDDNKRFYIVDRLKELIKYKAFQVPPAEIEAILISHPQIIDAGVIGIPDERAGELPMAFIVKQPNVELTENEVINHVAKHLSPQKWLRGGVRFINQIPRNPTGKIVRRELRKLAEVQKSKL